MWIENIMTCIGKQPIYGPMFQKLGRPRFSPLSPDWTDVIHRLRVCLQRGSYELCLYFIQKQSKVPSPNAAFRSISDSEFKVVFQSLFLFSLSTSRLDDNCLDAENIMRKWRKLWIVKFSPSRALRIQKYALYLKRMTLWLSWSKFFTFFFFFKVFCLFGFFAAKRVREIT